MSALEQIRKRPAITIGIVGFALILFLFTGINGCDRIMNRNYDTAATVDGHKIKINELNAATESMRNGGNYDNAMLAQQALQDLINKALLNDAIEKAGIKVTDEEISSLIYGADALPYFVQQANQYGFNTMDELYDFSVSGEPGSEQAKAIIDGVVKEVREGLAQQKFNTLLGAINVNKLDAQASFDASAVTSKITFARQDLNTIPDDAVVVSDDEIRTAYNKERERYAIPGKEVSADYISVRISPSDADYAAAQKEVEDAVVALGETSGTEAVADNYAFTVKTVAGTRESINDTQIKNNLDSIVKFGVRVLSTSNNNFAIAKLISQKTGSEKANVDIVGVLPGVNADSIMALLNEGLSIDSISTELAMQQASNEEVNLINGSLGVMADTLANAALNNYFVLQSDPAQGAILARVVSRTEPETIYEFASITRPVEASPKTYQDALEALTGYLAENKTLEAFKENAAAAGYTVQQVAIDDSQLSILGLPSSTGAARWAMENKKGAVSPIFTDDDHSYLLALAINDVYSDYRPVSDPTVANPIRQRLISEKKAAKLVDELKTRGAKSVDAYAQAMGTAVEEADVNYGSGYVRGFVPGDAVLLANVKAAKEGQLVGPLATQNSVVVFVVNSTEKAPREYDFDAESKKVQNTEIGALQRNFDKVLRGNKKIKYNVQRFYNNDTQE